MTKRYKLILSIAALLTSLAMVVISIGSALAFSDETVENINQLKQARKTWVQDDAAAMKQVIEAARQQRQQKIKNKVKNKIQGKFMGQDRYKVGEGKLKDKARAKADRVVSQVCERTKERYQRRLDFYRSLESGYDTRYQTVLNRIEAILDALESFGVDVTEAREKFAILHNKIDVVIASLKENEATLESLANVDCSDIQSAREQVKAARSQLKETRQKAKDARDYYKMQLKPVILSIKDQPGR